MKSISFEVVNIFSNDALKWKTGVGKRNFKHVHTAIGKIYQYSKIDYLNKITASVEKTQRNKKIIKINK